MPAGLRAILLGAGLCLAAPAIASAQGAPVQPPLAVLLVDSDRLFRESAFGQRVIQEQQADIAILSTENRNLAAELTEEEQRLTEQRASMSPADFRKVADAFDARVTEIRRLQDQKEFEIAQRTEAARLEFIGSLVPVWDAMLRQSGAQVILDKRSALYGLPALDVTDTAIQTVNTLIGDGASDAGEEDALPSE